MKRKYIVKCPQKDERKKRQKCTRWTNESSFILLYFVIFIFKEIPKDIRDKIGI